MDFTVICKHSTSFLFFTLTYFSHALCHSDILAFSQQTRRWLGSGPAAVGLCSWQVRAVRAGAKSHQKVTVLKHGPALSGHASVTACPTAIRAPLRIFRKVKMLLSRTH